MTAQIGRTPGWSAEGRSKEAQPRFTTCSCQNVCEPVHEHERQQGGEHRSRPRPPQVRARKEQRGQHEKQARHAVVISEVDGRCRSVPRLGVQLRRHEDALGKVHAALGGDPGKRKEHEDDGKRDPGPIAAARGGEPRPGTPGRERREEDGHGDADRRERVRGLCVEIVLVDDAGPGDDRAQGDGGSPGDPRPARKRVERE